ncbi:MAG TPA: hypothetical protein VH305_10100 [Gaiella sp.]|jgi:hypothetical protein
MDVVLAFVAALVSLRLAADLVRRWRARRTLDLLAWSASLAAFAAASGALAWGAAAGWDDRAFRAYYLFGGLLTAALLGAGSLLRARVSLAAPVVLVYVGLAVGVALSVPLDPAVTGADIPDAAAHLSFFPARALALAGNVSGTAAAVVVAMMGIRRRPLGNSLIVAGVAAAAVGSAVAGLGAGGGSAFTIVAASLLYAGFVSAR